MCVHIAIPEPTGADSAFNQRSLPAYLAALRSAGATPIIVPLHEHQDRVARLLASVQAVLLPGSNFHVDPQRYGESAIPECATSDPARAAVDELLLQDAFNLHKPILAICYGIQTLNVWLNGSLIQHLKTSVNHSPGDNIAEAHPVRITPGSRLAAMIPGTLLPSHRSTHRITRQSRYLATVCWSAPSHHQMASSKPSNSTRASTLFSVSNGIPSAPTPRAPSPAPSSRPSCRQPSFGSPATLKKRSHRYKPKLRVPQVPRIWGPGKPQISIAGCPIHSRFLRMGGKPRTSTGAVHQDHFCDRTPKSRHNPPQRPPRRGISGPSRPRSVPTFRRPIFALSSLERPRQPLRNSR